MTQKDKEKLIELINSDLPSWFTELYDANSERYGPHVVIRKDQVIELIKSIEFEPTEDSAKDTERCSQPNWEEMYKEAAALNKDLQLQNERQMCQLERAWASLRTFEFIYGRKLDGIC